MAERKTSSPKSPGEMSGAWRELPWRKLEVAVYRMQKLLLKSEAARLLAVRRVTQDNQGKQTAGVDGVKSVPPNKR